MAMAAGSRVGPYEIVSLLGIGGMGEVYKARDSRLDRLVAIKLLRAEVAERADRRARFETEARATSSLTHPHICRLYDVGDDNGRPYIVMEYLEGETLDDRLTRGPLPATDVMHYAVQIADALAHAHRTHIVHRDLKPSNVMLTSSGAKLLDFGLARLDVAEPAALGTSTIVFRASTRSPRKVRSSARFSTWRRSNSKAKTLMCAPTSLRSARCCTRWRRDERHSMVRPKQG